MSLPFYRAFEDRYRGSRELIHERQQVYVPFLEPLKELYPQCKALDVGCGRGEWLEILQQQGFEAQGIDLDAGMLEACHALGLSVEQGDALEKLKSLPDESLTVVSGFHFAEHVPFDVLKTLITETLRVLKPGGLLILETPNAENLTVGTNTFYLDPSHERPIPHLLLSFLTEYCGFSRSKLLRLQEPAALAEGGPVNLVGVLFGVSPDYAIVAQKQASAELMAEFDGAFDREYGLSLDRLADRYDIQVAETGAQLNELRHHHGEVNNQVQDLVGRTAQVEQSLQQTQETANSEALHIHAELADIKGDSQRLRESHDQLKTELVRFDNDSSQIHSELARIREESEHVRAELARLHGEAELVRLQNQAYQAHITAILNSASWRSTHPLRVSKSIARSAVRLPKRVMRSVLARSIRFVLNKPGLRVRISEQVKSYPQLFQRVRQFALNHGLIQVHPDDLSPVVSTTEASEDGFADASPRVAAIYRELKLGFERKENH